MSLKNKISNVVDEFIIKTLDEVLQSNAFAWGFGTGMITANIPVVQQNNHGGYALLNVVQNLNATVNSIGSLGGMIPDWDKYLVEPNIAGIPISAESVSTSREVEISESMVIVQSEASKKYWTDNAVPRLKEWTVQGYITAIGALDHGFLIKPTLVWQMYYLDVCAKSRRPVLFKTNQGEFVKVQITNLNTIEEASYNNAIKVSISLKEYNPYFVSDEVGSIKVAEFIGGN